ncbi:GAF domain-containing protein [Nakamurella sp. YIM 132087]|uniref:GAF domain-containing protein n=1 Tax=Nakamurella alba TaxID=2665158 RepID=A0A7K1FV38_9ACTN|nr:GAF domain-containing protein [Nakamurella alba]MTD16694.1 GAF domain-containing protein [Nakamurella alba]
MPADPGPSWLQLLLDGTDAAGLAAARRSALRSTRSETARSVITAEAGRAEQLLAQLVEHRAHAAELTSLYDLSLRLSREHSLDALLQDTVSHARRLLAVDVAYLALVEDDQSLTIRVTDGSTGPNLRGIVLAPRSGLAGRVVELAEPVQSRDYLADRALAHQEQVDQVADTEGLRTILGAPLRLRGSVIGVLMVSQREVRHFGAAEISLLGSLGSIAAVAIDNARLIEGYRHSTAALERTNEQLSATLDSINRAATLHETLLEVATRAGRVPDVVRTLSSVVAGTVLFADAADRVVTAAASGAEVETVSLEPVSGRGAARVFTDPAMRRTRVERSTVTVPIATPQDYVGALQVRLDAAVVSDADVRMLERAAMTIALVAFSERALLDAERRTTTELLEQILSRRIDDETAMTGRARHLGLDLASAHTVAVLEPLPDNAGPALALAREVVDRNGGLAERVLGAVVLVTPAAEETVRTALRRRWRSQATVGIATATAGSAGLADGYDAAVGCVAALHALGRVGDLATVDELGPYRFLLSRAGRDDAARFVRATIGAVIDHDRSRGTDLVRTMDVFLSGGRQHAGTAAALQIHVNTLYQRLDRITDRLGEGWRDGDRAHDVQLALRIHRLLARS